MAAAVALPDSQAVENGSLKLRVLEMGGSGIRIVEIDAEFPHRRAAQKVTFVPRNGQWIFDSAELMD